MRNALNESSKGPKAMLQTVPPVLDRTVVGGASNGRFEPNLTQSAQGASGRFPEVCLPPDGLIL
jgi:hypothetical protein